MAAIESEMTGLASAAAADGIPRIDLVLMDINLGEGMDGTEAAQRILAMRDIPLVFLSSHTEPEVVARTEGITNYGYIVKNSGPTVLFMSIKMAFKLHEARQELEASELHYREIFMDAAVALLEEDFSGAKRRIDALKAGGVTDIEGWLAIHPEETGAMVGEVRILAMNHAYQKIFGFKDAEALRGKDISVLPTVDPSRLAREFATFASGTPSYIENMEVARTGLPPVTLRLSMAIPSMHMERWDRVYVSFIDVTEEKSAERRLETLVRDRETRIRELGHR